MLVGTARTCTPSRGHEEGRMQNKLFSLIRKIARRNGSAAYYPFSTFVEDGVRYMTCGGWLSAETNDNWLFSDVSDEEAKLLLKEFISDKTYCTFEVLLHFARLMAQRGTLVAEQMDDVVRSTDWGSYASPQLLLSYLAVKPDGTDWILRLLDVVPSDARDGLFIACWHCRDRRVHRKLLCKFEEWTQEGDFGGGDGEDWWLGRFLTKWTRESTFGWRQMKRLIEWSVSHNLLLH